MSKFDQIKWDEIYSRQTCLSVEPPAWLEEFRTWLIPDGLGLDIASGSGRIALWLAGLGLNVTAIDISEVALSLASANSEKRGFTIETMVIDLDELILPVGGFDVITCFHYWQPDLFTIICDSLRPGGIFMAEIFTEPNLERHEHPRAQYLAETGKLKRVCDSLQIIGYEEGWLGENSLARLVARKHKFPSDSG